METKCCKMCGCTFETDNKCRVYCSNSCKSRARIARNRILMTCEGCGREFWGSPDRHQRYCSISCQVSHQKLKKTLICQVCGREFEFTGRTIQKRCPECKAEFRSLRTMERRKAANPCVKLGVGSGHNQTVGVGADAETRKTRRLRYRKLVEAGNYTATRDYRSKVITGHDKCEACGYNLFQEALVVHHKDMDRRNNDTANLAVLCANCHAVLHGRIRKCLKQQDKPDPVEQFNLFLSDMSGRL